MKNENDLEFDLRLNTESEHESLYPWSIDEVDENGKIVGQENQIPYERDFYFTAKNISFHSQYEIKNCLDPKNKFEISDNEFINMELEPEDKYVSFSKFGTNEKIKEFKLNVFPESEERKEVKLWGHLDPNSISIAVPVKERKFKQLVDLVTHKSLNSFLIRITGVEGFYSRWSPDGAITFVKVLTIEHELAIPEDSKIEPPRIGRAKEIGLYPESTQKLAASQKQSEDEVNENNESDEVETDKLEKIILKLKNLLWGIIFLLVFIILILI